MEIVFILALLVGLFLLNFAATHWGDDSRPGFGDIRSEIDPASYRAVSLFS